MIKTMACLALSGALALNCASGRFFNNKGETRACSYGYGRGVCIHDYDYDGLCDYREECENGQCVFDFDDDGVCDNNAGQNCAHSSGHHRGK